MVTKRILVFLSFPIASMYLVLAQTPVGTNQDDDRMHHIQKRQSIGCPRTGRTRLFRCPTLNDDGSQSCINDDDLCNHVPNCPQGEDEQPSLCLFYKVIDRQLKTLFDFIVQRFETHVNRRH